MSLQQSLMGFFILVFSFQGLEAYCSLHENPSTKDEVVVFVDSMILNMLGRVEDCPKKLRNLIFNSIEKCPENYRRYSWFMECCWDRDLILNAMFGAIDGHICLKAKGYLDGSYNPSYVDQVISNLRYALDLEKNRYLNSGYDGLYYPFFGGRLKSLIENVAKGTSTFDVAIHHASKGYKSAQVKLPPTLTRICAGLVACNVCGRGFGKCADIR